MDWNEYHSNAPIDDSAAEARYEANRTERLLIQEGVNEMKARQGRRELAEEKRGQIKVLEAEISELRSAQEGMELEVISELHRRIWEEFESSNGEQSP
jgi:hypothetical protein